VVEIVFSSLLLGLVAGVQPVSVEIAPAGGARSVVFSIDGRTAATVGSPFHAELDFGAELRPHELVATAYDAAGRAVGRAVRRLNTPQPAARLEILLEEDTRGRPATARLVSTSVRSDRPIRQSLELDGKRLDIGADGRARLPPLDLDRVHVLSAVADYGEDATARADLAFGGGSLGQAGSRLTAVPILVIGDEAPSTETLRGAFVGPKGLVDPAAIEKADATVLFVRHPLPGEAARHLGKPNRDYPVEFLQDERVSYVWPVPRKSAGDDPEADLFESMGPFGRGDKGFHWLLSHVGRIGRPVPPPYRYADAVAVAGLQASGSSSRRAVVLVEGTDRQDASRFSPSMVRGYLESLGVPLRVWALTGVASQNWSGVSTDDVSSLFKLSIAVSRLQRDLAAQRVVWVAGDWAPGEIRLSPAARGFALLR
jgi:hypothetical protein